MSIDFPLDRIGQAADKFRSFIDEPHLLFIFPNVILSGNGTQLIFHTVGGILQQQAEFFRAKFFQVFIRIFCILDLENLHLKSRLFQNRNSTLGGVLTGLITVIDQDDLVGVAGHESRLLFGQGGAQRCHRIVKAILMKGHHVNIAFHQNQRILLGLLGKIQAKQILALIEDQGLRRV